MSAVAEALRWPALALAVGLGAAAGLSSGGARSATPCDVGRPAWLDPPPPWPVLFDDTFSGPAGAAPDRRHWRPETGGHGWGNNELQQYTGRRANAHLDGEGHLVVRARRERFRGRDGIVREFTSARLTTRDRFSFRYGRIEARVRVPAGRGLLPAVWALGDATDRVGWPRGGELDVVEAIGTRPAEAFASIHGARDATGHYALSVRRTLTPPPTVTLRTYTATWTPGGVTFAVDGVAYGRCTRADLPARAEWPFDRPFHLLISLAVGGELPGSPDRSVHWPATLLVDRVRVLALPTSGLERP